MKAAEVEGRFLQLGRSSERLGLAFRALTAGFAIGGLFRLADAYTTVRNRLDLVSDSTAQAATRFEVIKDLANETRAPLEETAKFFSQLTLNSKNLGLSFEETVGITRTLNQVIALTGQSTEASKNALIQLQQAFGSGALRGDELRSVMEQIPLLTQLIADKMGIGVGQLKDFAEQGLVTAEVVADALSSSAEEIDKAFQKSRFTFSQAFTILLNGITAAIGRFNEATGIFQNFAKLIAWVGKEIELLGAIALGVSATFGALWTVTKLVTFIQYLTTIQATMVSFRAGLVLTTGTMTGLQLLMSRFTASLVAARAAMVAFVFSNPFTAIAQAVVVVIGLLYSFKDALVINRETGATLGDLLIYAFDRVRAALVYVWETFMAWFQSMQVYMPMIQQLFTTFGNIAYQVFNALYATVNTIVSIFDNLGINMYTFITILQMALNLFAYFVDLQLRVVSAVYEWVKGLFVVNGELTAAGKIATDLFEGFVKDIDVVARELQALAAGIKFFFVEGFKIIRTAVQEAANWAIDWINKVKDAINEFADTFGFQAIAKTTKVTVQGSMSASEYFNGIQNAYNRAYQSGGVKNTLKDAVRLGIDTSNEKNWFNDLASKQSSTTDAVNNAGNNVAKTTAAGSNAVSSTVKSGASSTVSAINGLESSLANAVSDSKDKDCCCCQQGGGPVPEPGAPGGPPAGSMGGTGTRWDPRLTYGDPNHSGFGSNLGTNLGLTGTTGTVGGGSGIGGFGTSLPQSDMTASEIKKANEAAKAVAENSARMAYGYKLLEQTIAEQINNGVLSASEAAGEFSEGSSLLKRALDDPTVLTRLKAAGETMYSSLIDQVLAASVNASDFLTSTKVTAANEQGFGIGGSSSVSSSGTGGTQYKVSRGSGIAGFGNIVEQLVASGFQTGDNPFEFISKYAEKTGQSVEIATKQVSAFTSALRSGAADINSTIGQIAQQYNLLDLARKNVSGNVYGGVNPNVRIDGFANGGSFMVGGQPGVDKNLIQFMASRGEEVEIRTRRQQKEQGSKTVANSISVNFNGVSDIGSFRANRAEVEAALLRAMRRQERLGR